MADYTLYYWPLPFRGEFIRYVLGWVGATWDEPGADKVMAMKSDGVAFQPVPFMAPPMLLDNQTGLALSQMPAILTYLGEKHGLIPAGPVKRAQTQMLIANANDVLDDLTRNGGKSMWLQAEWDDFFVARFERWMLIFEHFAAQNGLQKDSGHILGTDAPGLADLVTAALWGPMCEKLPPIADLLSHKARRVTALTQRITQTPAIAAVRADSERRFGAVYCGGEIEKSIRAMLARTSEGG